MEARDIGSSFLASIAGKSEDERIHAMYARMMGLPLDDVRDIPTEAIIEVVTAQGNESILNMVRSRDIYSSI